VTKQGIKSLLLWLTAIPFGSRVEITDSVRGKKKPVDAAVAPSTADNNRKGGRIYATK
jgi:hypothetical protein